ncbi:non-ribosomal peptide synthetase [Rhizobium tubonense]|uniref:Carrier domain-containing protein n=1 Tax=Rhizobium tubonense TaxID=484088 RepID=A0A2W4E4B9_9HYPH|nr:non-ribosomal peptide synthetase [Rhizobium tubonense]PZM07423.1 hypothetical protein CPY51_31680 [Rhizobium tubonense]
MTDLYPNTVNRRSAVIQFDRDRNLQDMVRQQAETAPDAIAIDFDGRLITYAELDGLSEKLAVHLQTLGVVKGNTVALVLPRAISTVVSKLAILKAGAAYISLDPALPPSQIEQILLECKPELIFAGATRQRKLWAPDLAAAIFDLDEILDALVSAPAVERLAVEIGGADTAYVMPTIGLTGQVKGVPVMHRSISRVVLDQNYIKFNQGDVVLQTSASWFDAEALEMWGALLTGCALVGMPAGAFSLSRLCDLIRKAGVTTMFLTTEIFNRLADKNTSDLQSLKHVVFGGEIGSAEHVGRFLKAHPGCKITNAYGPNEVNAFETTIAVPAKLDNPQMKDVALGRAAREVSSLRRDAARIDARTGIEGTRAELDAIEAALRGDPRLRDGVAMCHEQGSKAKRIVAYLRPHSTGAGKDPHFVRQVMANLRSTLPAYMIPDCAVVLDDFPMDQAGNIEREKLPVPGNAAKVDDVSSAPGDQTEIILTELWQGILGRSNIGLDRNFFDLGGTSLQLIHAHARLEAKLGRAIDVVALFTYSTIRDLSRFLDGKTTGSTRSMSAAQRATLQRQTRFQFRRSAL